MSVLSSQIYMYFWYFFCIFWLVLRKWIVRSIALSNPLSRSLECTDTESLSNLLNICGNIWIQTRQALYTLSQEGRSAVITFSRFLQQ